MSVPQYFRLAKFVLYCNNSLGLHGFTINEIKASRFFLDSFPKSSHRISCFWLSDIIIHRVYCPVLVYGLVMEWACERVDMCSWLNVCTSRNCLFVFLLDFWRFVKLKVLVEKVSGEGRKDRWKSLVDTGDTTWCVDFRLMTTGRVASVLIAVKTFCLCG